LDGEEQHISLDDLGNIGEFVGAVAVVISLAYLAVQIRQNTRAVKTSTFHGVTDSFNHLNTTIANDESLARIFRVGSGNLGDLTADEQVRFGFLFLSAFRIFETLYYQNKQGTGDPALWAAEGGTMVALLSGPGALEWWESNPLSFTPEFRVYVEREVLAPSEIASSRGPKD
jgi:hypothetical protein